MVKITHKNREQRSQNSRHTQTVAQTGTTNNKKDDAQSYENLVAAIYNNQDEVLVCVSADEDYLKPHAFGEAEERSKAENNPTMQLPSKLSDTDGDSYEDMERCAYAQPRKLSQRNPNANEDEDYINPDNYGESARIQKHTNTDYLNPCAFVEAEERSKEEDNPTLQLPGNLSDTDGDSYEDMERCAYAQPRKLSQRISYISEDEDYINPDDCGEPDSIQYHTDTDSYELMNGDAVLIQT
ncbi:hypothetical protein DNTS_020586 [Danionella cerebrum]|uniref:Uncharacterized protein n=1 Tax=Danionella cerebrum TaxID=2873325 RepID=A0A553R556_9TELE|nr:hypothetical protein DNTS_020586 [Danionella translucida]